MEERSPIPPPPKLLDQVRDRLRVKHYSIRTEQAYVDWIKRFIWFQGKRHPKDNKETSRMGFNIGAGPPKQKPPIRRFLFTGKLFLGGTSD